MRLESFVLKIKRKETPFYAAVHDAVKRAQRFEIPAPRAVYTPLLHAHQARLAVSDAAARTLLWQPMFRARCEECGPGLLLYCGFPYIYGDLRLRVGANCKIHGHTSLVAGRVLDAPRLTLGDRVSIGYGVVISVSGAVTLGNDVRLADGCFVTDNPGHPLDAEARRSGAPPEVRSIAPVVLEDDVWLGTRVTVLPGVRIGRGTVVGAGSVVTRDLPSGVLAAGNPARVLRTIAREERTAQLAEDVTS